MKKLKIFLFLCLIVQSVVIANINDDIKKQELSVITGVPNLPSKTKNITADMFSADQLLKELSRNNKKVENLYLIFPDVKILDDYINSVAEKADNIVVFSLANETKNEYFVNRGIRSSQFESLKNKLKNLNNIKIYTINSTEEDLDRFLKVAFEENSYDNDVYKKYGIQVIR